MTAQPLSKSDNGTTMNYPIRLGIHIRLIIIVERSILQINHLTNEYASQQSIAIETIVNEVLIGWIQMMFHFLKSRIE